MKLSKGLNLQPLFKEMIKDYQREFGKGAGKYIENKLELVPLGEISPYLLKISDEIVGYLEYEKVTEEKVCFYVLYVIKKYREVEVIKKFLNQALTNLQLEGINQFVVHINPLSTLPLEASLLGCGFKKYLRNEMSIKLKSFTPSSPLEVYPFHPKYLDELKSLMLLAFNGFWYPPRISRERLW